MSLVIYPEGRHDGKARILVGLKVKNIEPRDMQDHGTLVNIQAPTELNLGKFLFLKDVNI